MEDSELDFTVERLGDCRIPSPMAFGRFVRDSDRILYHGRMEDLQRFCAGGNDPLSFEAAGPRERIFFDPRHLVCGIVTCGGICPGLNDVIRAIVLSLFHHYGVRTVFGFRYGFEGISSRHNHFPMVLTPETVEGIHQKGGTILGSSRGPQDVGEMVDTLASMDVGILFAIGGDGTLKGAHDIAREIGRRGLRTSVIGIPKTIDNDILFVEESFGFQTAISEARKVISAAHCEASGARNGIGLVKLMGRQSGFIAAYATLANSDVNYCLVPEVPFTCEGFLEILRKRLAERGHAVIVVGEGAGQDLMEKNCTRDASGNVRLSDIGVFLRDSICKYFSGNGIPVNLKYIDPSYTIRSTPANARDSAFCLLLGHYAVHAGMAGRTDMVVGTWKNEFTHLPIRYAVSGRKQLDPDGRLWSGVLGSTGQPREMT
jgi:6-phosphofructokinase 1